MTVSTNRKPGGSSLVEKAYREIKQRILQNTLSPGHQALEQEVAADLDMSRTPVREALIRLEKEGLGKWGFATDPYEMAKMMIAHIDKKRKALGIDKARERILVDMADRRALDAA